MLSLMQPRRFVAFFTARALAASWSTCSPGAIVPHSCRAAVQQVIPHHVLMYGAIRIYIPHVDNLSWAPSEKIKKPTTWDSQKSARSDGKMSHLSPVVVTEHLPKK